MTVTTNRLHNVLLGFLTLIIFSVQVAWCLREVKLLISPQAVIIGKDVMLDCLYDLDGDPLYSVKWYKGHREIYRYVPNYDPPTKVFPFKGIQIDESRSSAHRVALSNVSFALSGIYSCEVSADAPSFKTSFVTEEMMVIALPDRKPDIEPERSDYEINDILRVNCTSGPSKPATNLSFFINENRVSSDKVKRYPPRITIDNLEAAVSGMEIKIAPVHYYNGALKLKCVAELFDIYAQGSQVTFPEKEQPKRPSFGAREAGPEGGHSGAENKHRHSFTIFASHLVLHLISYRISR